MLSKPLAAKLAAILLASASGVALAASTHATATSGLPVAQDALAPLSLTPGQSSVAHWTVHSTDGQCHTYYRLTVAVRGAGGSELDFPGAHSATVCPGGYTFTSGPRSFPAGNYQVFGSIESGSTWHPFPSSTLAVASASPSPSPSTAPPSPSPTPTSSPTASATPSPSTSASGTTSASPSPSPSQTSSPTPTPTPTSSSSGPLGIPGTWNTVLDDTFSTDGGVLRPIWHNGWFDNSKPVDSHELQGYSTANVHIDSDGYLHLDLGAKGALLDTDPSQGGNFTFTGTAAAEARVYLPGTAGVVYNWPAFWTNGQSWPSTGESDIMEGLSGQTCYHVHTNAGGPGNCVNVGSGWHTFGEKWDAAAQQVTFYYDGVNVGSEPFVQGNSPQYLIFDYTSEQGDTIAGASMLVDYVRVWK